MIFHKDAFNTFKGCELLKCVELSGDILETIRDYLLFTEIREKVYKGLVKSKPMSYCPESRGFGIGQPCSEREYVKHGIHPGRLCLNKIKDMYEEGWVNRGEVPLMLRIQIEKIANIKNFLYIWGYKLIQYSVITRRVDDRLPPEQRICTVLSNTFRRQKNDIMMAFILPPLPETNEEIARVLLDREELEEREKLEEE
jgi:hypothetical protein